MLKIDPLPAQVPDDEATQSSRETCELSRLSASERKRWIGWEPTPPELMLLGRVRSREATKRRVAKMVSVAIAPIQKTFTDTERLLMLAGYKPTRGVCTALETDPNYRASIHRTALRMTEGDNGKRAELAHVYEALCR